MNARISIGDSINQYISNAIYPNPRTDFVSNDQGMSYFAFVLEYKQVKGIHKPSPFLLSPARIVRQEREARGIQIKKED
jgi:hypothetical protein